MYMNICKLYGMSCGVHPSTIQQKKCHKKNLGHLMLKTEDYNIQWYQ